MAATTDLHSHWEEIKIHTAKCDKCNEHNKSIMYRCTDGCSRQLCTPCKLADPQSGKHPMYGGMFRRNHPNPEATRRIIAHPPALRRPLRTQNSRVQTTTERTEPTLRRPQIQTSQARAAIRNNASTSHRPSPVQTISNRPTVRRKARRKIKESDVNSLFSADSDSDVPQRDRILAASSTNMTPRAAALKAKFQIAATGTRRRRDSSGSPQPNRQRRKMGRFETFIDSSQTTIPSSSAAVTPANSSSAMPCSPTREIPTSVVDTLGLDILSQVAGMMAPADSLVQTFLDEASSTGSSHQNAQRRSPLRVAEAVTSMRTLSFTEATPSLTSLETLSSTSSTHHDVRDRSPLMIRDEFENPLVSQELLDPVFTIEERRLSMRDETEVPDSQPVITDSRATSLDVSEPSRLQIALAGPLNITYDPSIDTARLTIASTAHRGRPLFMSRVRLTNGTLLEYPSSSSVQD